MPGVKMDFAKMTARELKGTSAKINGIKRTLPKSFGSKYPGTHMNGCLNVDAKRLCKKDPFLFHDTVFVT